MKDKVWPVGKVRHGCTAATIDARNGSLKNRNEHVINTGNAQ